jgi:small subunit ribosomal protein S16
MIIIRLSRGGSKKTPWYNVVVADSRNRRDGRFIERIGFYNPMANTGTEALRIDNDRVTYWKGHGALLSDSVNRLVKLHLKGPEAIMALKKKDADKIEARKAKEAAKKAEELKAAMDAKEAEEKAKVAKAEAASREAPASKAIPVAAALEAAPVEAAAPEATPKAAPAEATEPPAKSA